MSPRMCLLWIVPILTLFAIPPGPDGTGLAFQPAGSRPILFCFWNVENFFDDKVNPKLAGVDREFDDWFAKDLHARPTKLARIAWVLSKEMNGGRGPDILALAEMESLRAVELVRDALNRRLKEKALHYRTVVYRDPKGGRSIATAVLSRLPIVAGQTRLLGKYQRILKVHVRQGKHELVVIASHWTSRVSDVTGSGRKSYARLIHDDFAKMYRTNPAVDYLVCGDFNDTPDDEAVTKDLGAVGDVKKVLSLGKRDRPLLYNPFSDFVKSRKGTHYYRDKAYVFDHICLSPGLLDGEGWSYVNRSAAIVEKLSFRGRPDRFGGPNDRRPWKNRGASDHYPVTVQLRVP